MESGLSPLFLQPFGFLKDHVEMKRKLVADASPAEQFHTLRQIPGLSAADCREVIHLLREDDKGVHTCHRQEQKFPEASKMMREVRLPGVNGLVFHYNSLPELVYEKTLRCPLFATMMKEAMKVANGNLTLVIFSDEANPGNILHGRHPRKTNLVYASFLELPCLFVDSMWLPLSAQRADDVSAHETSYAEIMRHLLEAIYVETECGLPICIESCGHLVFIDRVLLLNDHEGLRSVIGAKGSAAMKPCCHCSNVLSLGRACPPGYTDISEMSPSKFVRQTDKGLMDIRNHFAMCATKKEKKDAETMLGWNADNLEKSALASPVLQHWIRLDSLYLDAMHEYHSCGMVAQELGLWYTQFKDCGYTLEILQRWVAIGWTASQGDQQPHLVCSEKLLKYDMEYRGDASACRIALPLVWAFSVEVLHGDNAMDDAVQSISALYDVVRCLQRAKICVSQGEHLLALQCKHLSAFQKAYGASVMRPKAHYALHLSEQMRKWHRLIDCHVGERKHRLFKRYVGPKISRLEGYARSVLLHLTEMELSGYEPAERLLGQTIGVPREHPCMAKRLKLQTNATFSSGFEIGCVSYQNGAHLRMSQDCYVEVQGGVSSGHDRYLLVAPLHRETKSMMTFPKWIKSSTHLALLPIERLKGQEPYRLIRRDATGIWLLR
jgi:hypothetical protein